MVVTSLDECSLEQPEIKSAVRESVTVLLPTYCEAGNIENLIREIQELDLNLAITVIDDSSPDGTPEIVKRLQEEYGNIQLVSRKGKLGLGTAITAGLRLLLNREESPDYIITMDADYSHNPQDIPRLVLAAEKGNDLVIGSRYIPGGETKDWPLKRKLISRAANLAANFIIGRKMQDCTSGFRCYSKRYVKTVISSLHSQTFEIQIETIRQAFLNGFKVKQIPISFAERKKGQSKMKTAEMQGFIVYVIKRSFGRLSVNFGRKS